MTKEYIYIYVCMYADVCDYTYVDIYIHIYTSSLLFKTAYTNKKNTNLIILNCQIMMVSI